MQSENGMDTTELSLRELELSRLLILACGVENRNTPSPLIEMKAHYS